MSIRSANRKGHPSPRRLLMASSHILAATAWFWGGFIAFVFAMLALDLGVFHRRPHVVHPREAATWTAVWVGLTLLFAGALHLISGPRAAVTFLTGYIIEESLSVDNIFVIVLIFAYFRVQADRQHRVLFYGILGALMMRGIFIGLGALMLARFHWVTYLLAALLIATGVRMALKRNERFDGERTPVVRFVRRILPFTNDYRGNQFFTVEEGRRMATPLLLVLVLIEFTDLVFAIDSIPAVFGVTRDPFIVFTSNIFAVLGLRSLYFLLARAVDRFHLLKYGLAVVLTFVGVKMLGLFEIDVVLSLAVVLGLLAASIVASLLWSKRTARGIGEGKP